jgi:hypothetical protein
MYDELRQAILTLMKDKRWPKHCEDLFNPLFISVADEDSLPQVIEVLKHQRELIQSMADRLGRLAVAISVGPQAVIEFKESLDNE